MKVKVNKKCVFCKGYGVIKTFNFNQKIPDGTYNLKFLIEKYGEYVRCPEKCTILN